MRRSILLRFVCYGVVSLFALALACAQPPAPPDAKSRPSLALEFDAPEAAQSGPGANGDELPGTVTFDGVESPVELALRSGPASAGRVIDVDLKKKRRLFGMRGFRLRPDAVPVAARTAVVYAHLRREGVLAPRVEWVSLSIDAEDTSSGFLEEVVAKELLEAQLRREGVTFGLRASSLPVVKIDVDGGKKIDEGDDLATQRDTADGLLRAFVDGALPADQVLDVDLMARFLCIAELWGAAGLLRAENLHFYFNPITQRIEPIADAGIRGIAGGGSSTAVLDQPWPTLLLRDAGLRRAFRREARRIADELVEDPRPDWWVRAVDVAGAGGEAPGARSERMRGAARRVAADSPGRRAGPAVTLRGDPEAPLRDRNPIPTSDLDDVLARHGFVEWNEDAGSLRVKAGSWVVAEPLVLPPGAGLEVGPGTTLRFDGEAFLLATGPLRWSGTADSPIVLEALPVETGEPGWPGIVVLRSDEPHHWAHVEVRNTVGITFGDWHIAAGVTFRASDVRIEDSAFRDNRTEDALNLIRSRFRFRDLSIRETISDAFDCDHCDGSFEGGLVRDVGGDGIDVSGSRVSVVGTHLESVRDKALSVGEESRLEASSVRIAKVGTGIASKDGSTASIEDSSLSDVEHVAVMAYRKKSAYGPARVDARRLDLARVGRVAVAQVGSTVVIDGALQPEEAIDVDALYDQGYMKK